MRMVLLGRNAFSLLQVEYSCAIYIIQPIFSIFLQGTALRMLPSLHQASILQTSRQQDNVDNVAMSQTLMTEL